MSKLYIVSSVKGLGARGKMNFYTRALWLTVCPLLLLFKDWLYTSRLLDNDALYIVLKKKDNERHGHNIQFKDSKNTEGYAFTCSVIQKHVTSH